ncbi:MAG: prepilin-type N-terminal cleavage/methylation domain-containing protein [Candidatus Zixiibacteriota bacterium]|nr:MAG: prepilin-type N-terminal cleavage/methylation domain-containing protein [candidate division Zixibacteria bacterium]
MYSSRRCLFGGNRGLSLLEVLVAMIVLAVGILGLAPMVVLSIEGNSISRDFSVATELARQQLEFYEAQDELLPEDPFKAEDQMVADSIATPPDTLGYTRWVRISPTEAVNPPRLCKVEVIISWTDKVGKPRSTKHSTLMTNY